MSSIDKYPQLPKTEKAIQDILSDSYGDRGSHRSSNSQLAKSGRPSSEIQYDPLKHSRFSPNPFSVGEELTDDEHVLLRKPKRPLDIDLVVHLDPNSKKSLSWVTRAKDDTMLHLVRGIDNLYTGSGDRLHTTFVGDVDRLKDNPLYERPDDLYPGDNYDASKVAASICKNGLTYLISSFNGLTFANDVPGVWIIVNHILEKKFLPGTAKFATGDRNNPIIDTRDQIQLEGWNKVKQDRHDAFITQMGNLGLSIAQVAFEGRKIDPTFGFDVAAADLSIASATNKFSDRM